MEEAVEWTGMFYQCEERDLSNLRIRELSAGEKTDAWIRSKRMNRIVIAPQNEIGPDLSRLRLVLCSVSIILGLVLAVSGHAWWADEVSYLDMGDAFFSGHWGAILNGLWSPLYPFLIGLTRWIVKPSMRWEPMVVQLTNLLVYVTTVVSFQFFWAETLRLYKATTGQGAQAKFATFSDSEFWILGYAIFLLMHLSLVTRTTPDMLLSTIVYLSAGLILRIRLRGPSLGSLCLLGLLLGLGFLAKAVMLPLAGVFLASAVLSGRPRRIVIPSILAAVLVFAGIVSPYVYELSKTKGHFTFGEVANLNYAWHVNGAPFIHWQGELAGLGKPQHPTREVFFAPLIYEFGSPVSATYPPWYDPSYWNEGLRARFDWAEQLGALQTNLREYLREFRSQIVLIVGVLVLLAMRPVGRTAFREYLAVWYLWVPALAAFAIYGLFWVEHRYVAQFFVLFWGAVLTLVRLPDGRDSRRLIRTVATIVVTLASMQVAADFLRDVAGGYRETALQMQIAEDLEVKGVRAGEKIAVLDAQGGVEWQKLLRVSVVAEIPYPEDSKFWATDQATRTQIYQVLTRAGANFLIASEIPDWASARGWEKIGGTPAYVFHLNR